MKNLYKNFKFYSGNRYMILATLETYTRTKSGKSWKTKPDEIERRVCDDEFYTNYVSAIPFYNTFFGYGATCRACRAYTEAGYLPVTVTTISPGREIKKVARFVFIHKRELEKTAGYREQAIIDAARRWQRFNAESWRYIEFIAPAAEKDDPEKTAVFDRVNKVWVN